MGTGAADRPSFMEESVMVFESSVDDGKYALCFFTVHFFKSLYESSFTFRGSIRFN